MATQKIKVLVADLIAQVERSKAKTEAAADSEWGRYL